MPQLRTRYIIYLVFCFHHAIRPFDKQKPCTKLKVNKPCYRLAEFVYLLLANSRVCLPFVNQQQGLFTSSLFIKHIEKPYKHLSTNQDGSDKVCSLGMPWSADLPPSPESDTLSRGLSPLVWSGGNKIMIHKYIIYFNKY